MNVDEFNYELPKLLIAQEPIYPKSSSKLLIADKKHITSFRRLTDYLDKKNLLVFNDTKVMPAIIKGKIKNSSIKITLHTKNTKGLWTAFANPSKKVDDGDVIIFKNELRARIEKKKNKEIIVKFNFSDGELVNYLIRYGSLPVPPYIKKKEQEEKVQMNYQTIFAKNLGAFACPTAGLHFDDYLLNDINKKCIDIVNVTLHVGAGTFLPLADNKIGNNSLHKEKGIISYFASKKIKKAINDGKKIVAVGTTVMRLLEACHLKRGKITEFKEDIDLFIKPGFNFKVVDKLITNFHLPKSSLLILVSAFAGKKKITDAYQIAIKNKMRFFSYGDAMLLNRK